MRILYVTGWCRSGSTLLANLLNELDRVVHVGELHYLWRNGVLGIGTNTTCGCGSPLVTCPLWSVVLARLTVGHDPVTLAGTAIAAQRRYLRTRHTGARLAESTGRRRISRGAREAVDRIVETYRAVGAQTGARLIVDSSKYPAEAAALVGRSDLDVRVLHLIRDPRASAYSWQRAKQYIPAMGVARSSAYWTAFNLASDRIGAAFPERYLRLRYEEFTAVPRAVLKRVLDLAGLDDTPSVRDDGTAVLGVNHTVTGNPDRLVRGEVRIRLDDGWRAALSRRDRWTAQLLAMPALSRYGYHTHGPNPGDQ